MRRYRKGAIVGLLVLLACGALAQAETIITSGGSVLQGTIEFGIPAVVSLTSSTGDVFTVQRTSLKSIRFPEEEGTEVTIETFDGNILIGELGGVPEVIGIETVSGDVQSVRLTSITEIRFDPAAAPTTPPPAEPVTPAAAPPSVVPRVAPNVDALVADVVEAFQTSKAGFTLGLDTGLQLGFTSKSGFDIPRWTLGFDFLFLGAVWRSYFGPSVSRVESAALELATEDPSLDLEDLTEETQNEVTPFLLPYLHVGTNALILPEIGGGVMLRLGRAIYIDLGASIDILGLFWFSVGLQIVL
ncbi:hypothetical protein ACFLTM_02365 [Candidatus Bipolaricaulota bacterium]